MSAIDDIQKMFDKYPRACSVMIDRDDWLAAVAEAEQLRERCKYLQQVVDGEFPEGCTPADARVLREANHALAAEVARLREQIALHQTVRERLTEFRQAAEQERDELRRRVAELEKPRFEFYAQKYHGELDCCFITNIFGLHAGAIADMEKEVVASLKEEIDDFPVDCGIDGCATNVSYFEGQQSFPETGQWDIAPHWEFDIEIAKVEEYKANQIEGGES